MLSKNKTETHSLVWSEVNLDYLRQNLKAVRSWIHSPRPVEILAVVKADAYGHGMKAVARALKEEGVGLFGVANIDEAIELRGACLKEIILVLGSFHKNQIPFYIKYKIRPTLSSLEDVALFEKALKKNKSGFPVHVKVDTGMGRLGMWHEDVEHFFKKISKTSPLVVEGVYTHFSSADHEDKSATLKQMALFEKIIKKINAMGLTPKYFHAANSMGLMRFKHSHLNLVRPGIILYGINPAGESRPPLNLKPILTLKTRISFLKEVKKGRTISYGATHKTARATRVATLPIGYSHGYRVGFSNKAFVVIGGRKCPVIGRVTMDQTLVDVGSLPSVKRWDEVTLIGREGEAQVLAQDLANVIGSIPYEIVCSIHSRIPRIYKGIH